VKALSEVYLPYGRSGILDCHFLSNPPLTNIRWEKDGFLFDPYNVPGVIYRKNGSLYFTKVRITTLLLLKWLYSPMRTFASLTDFSQSSLSIDLTVPRPHLRFPNS
jgi:hypothetical protein